MKRPHFEGWHLLGAFPNGMPNDVGSWLLVHGGDAALLEIPPGLTVKAVRTALRQASATLRFATASHSHRDHFVPNIWGRLNRAFPNAEFVHPSSVLGDRLLHIGGEPLWLIKAPKHSPDDVVAVFRGVAMTGDIELGTLASVNDEVPLPIKQQSMDWLRKFQERHGYQVHSIVSAHLNDVRVSVRWADLFHYEVREKSLGRRTQCRRYGCWGNLIPLEPDSNRLGSNFDMKCEQCGSPEWSDPRLL